MVYYIFMIDIVFKARIIVVVRKNRKNLNLVSGDIFL